MHPIFEDYAAICGIDWADKKHDICTLTRDKDKPAYSIIKSSPCAIEDWALTLQRRYPNERIAICVELSRGPIVNALLKYAFIDIFPINPGTLAEYRKTLRSSGAKDDPNDAYLQLDFLLKHGDKLKKLRPDSADIRALNQMVVQRRTLVGDKVRVTNRMTATLKAYFPQVLDWFVEKDTVVLCDFLLKWPTLAHLKRAQLMTIERFFVEHKSYRGDVIQRRLSGIKEAVPLTNDRGVVDPSVLAIRALTAQLRVLIHSISEYDKAIKSLCQSQADYKLFQGLPGAGPQLAPRLLAAMGSQRDRYQSAEEITRYVGVAPVTRSSGQSHHVRWRYACPTFLRQTFVEWANQSIRFSFWAKAYYEQQQSKGKPHQTIIRSLAFKWIRILFRCWKNHSLYDEARYLMALQKKSSPLLKNLAV